MWWVHRTTVSRTQYKNIVWDTNEIQSKCHSRALKLETRILNVCHVTIPISVAAAAVVVGFCSFYRVMLQSFIYYVYNVILYGVAILHPYSPYYVRGLTEYLIFRPNELCFARY